MTATVGQSYQPLGAMEPTPAQAKAAFSIGPGRWVEHAMLADGRVRVYVMDGRGLIESIHYVDRDGAVETP